MRPLSHNWHPVSNFSRKKIQPPLSVSSAKGSKIHLTSGQIIIDCISSWWCKNLGHSHPRLQKALKNQIEKFEHVIFANCTYDAIEELSCHLSQLHHDKEARVFYSGDGSSSIEIALKLTHHYMKDKYPQRNKFLALSNGYHGETVGAMSVSDTKIYKQSYQSLCFDTDYLDIPYDANPDISRLKNRLENLMPYYSAIIIEPLLQGAGGMLRYSAEVLQEIGSYAQRNDIPIIADEIMTGMGRCGNYLASTIATVSPDIICLSKGLTGGWLPFSATIVSSKFYEYFDGKPFAENFLHSHTYSGNPLGAALALELFAILKNESIFSKTKKLHAELMRIMECGSCWSKPRGLGGVVAIELKVKPNDEENFPALVTKIGIRNGILIRPLGNVLYLMPPLNISKSDLKKVEDGFNVTVKEIEETLIR